MGAAGAKQEGVRVGMVVAACLVIWAGLVALFAFNSGYGFDQLEYLLVGRSLAEGWPLYTWYTSKSFGIYVLVALLHLLGIRFGHGSLAVVIAAVSVAIVGLSFRAVRRFESVATASAAAGLIGLCTIFMELNFLQTEGFVFLAGLAAFAIVLGTKPRSLPARLFLAALAVGVGFHFKAVAVLYLGGILVFAVWLRPNRSDRVALVPALAALGTGFAAAALPAFLYFGLTGRAGPFLRWTVTFPLLDYPANTLYLTKLLTKLSVFHLVITCAVALLILDKPTRSKVWGNDVARLAALMGLSSLVQVLKTQASHYCFPGFAFLMISAAVVFVSAFQDRHVPKLIRVGSLALALLTATGSALAYRPAVLQRFLSVRDYSAETELAHFLQAAVPPGKAMFGFRQGTYLCWLAHRYPPPPFLDTAQITSWYLRNRPDVVFRALRDPQLALVGMDGRGPSVTLFDDPGFGGEQGDLRAIEKINQRLEEDFEPAATVSHGFTFWRRRGSP